MSAANFKNAVIEVIEDKLSSGVWDDYVPIIRSGEHTYSVYILDGIAPPHIYAKLTDLLYSLSADDVVHTHINTGGGVLDSAEMLYTAYKNTRAKTVAHVHGLVASAGTVITLAHSAHEISPTARFMVHESSGGSSGKSSDVHRQTTFNTRWLKEFCKTVYTGFLSQKEIDRALKGEELWFTGKEVTARLEEK